MNVNDNLAKYLPAGDYSYLPKKSLQRIKFSESCITKIN